MIEPQSGRDRQRLAASLLLGHWEKDLFLDPDVSEQAIAKAFVSSSVDCSVRSSSLVQQLVQPHVLGDHEFGEATSPNRALPPIVGEGREKWLHKVAI